MCESITPRSLGPRVAGPGSNSLAGDGQPGRLLRRDLRQGDGRRDARDTRAGRGPRAPRPRGDGGAGGELRLRRGRERGHDARQPRGLPPPADRPPHAARRRRARPLDHRPRHAAAGPAAARPDRGPEGRPRRRRAGDGPGRGGGRPADDRQHRLPLHDGGDRRGRRRGAALVPALLAQRPRAARELRRPRRGRRLRGDRRHRRHLHPRLEAARPAAGLAALPRRQRQRQLLPGPGLPRRARADAGGGHRRRDRAATSASSPTPR